MSAGSATESPPAFANSMRISVRLTTPTNRPLIRDPGSELAETEGPVGATNGVFGDASAMFPGSADAEAGGKIWCWPEPAEIEELCDDTGAMVADERDGVGGPDEDGDIGSVTQRR